MLRLTFALGTVALLAMPAPAQTARPAKPGTTARADPKADRCQPTSGIVEYRGGKAVPRKLNEMPPGTAIYAVYNVVDGCPMPVVVGQRNGDRTRPPPQLRVPPRLTKAN